MACRRPAIPVRSQPHPRYIICSTCYPTCAAMSLATPQSEQAHRYPSSTHILSPGTPDLEVVSPSNQGNPTTPAPSPPESTLSTPPQLGHQTPSLYSSGLFAYNGRARSALLVPSLSSGSSPSLLPIGPTQSTERWQGLRHSQRRLGLGLKMAQHTNASSSRSSSAESERARKRHAVLFLPHERSLEEHRPSDDGSEVSGISSRKRMAQRCSGVDERRNINGGRMLDGRRSECLHTEDGYASVSPALSVEDITAAFPSPPIFVPRLSRYLGAGFSPDRPPDIPLPPTPPSSSSRFSHMSVRSTFSTAVDNRLTVIDPDESLARLEMSMSVLDSYSATYDGSLSPDAGGSIAYSDSEPESDDRNLMDVIDTQPVKDVPTWLLPPGNDESPSDRHSEKVIISLTPTTFARVGFSHPSLAPTPTEEKEVLSDPTLLPQFDFEKLRRSRATIDEPPTRFSSLMMVKKPFSILSSSEASPVSENEADGRRAHSRRDKAMPFLFRDVRSRPTSKHSSFLASTVPPAAVTDIPELDPVQPTVLASRSATPPPDIEDAGQLSFMNLTPEPLPSRASKLWTRTMTGAMLRKEKSTRWLRGSFVQPRAQRQD
ncbi:hypothetical protein B0H21DRAFT_731150 [Amylocystis lapponica]|nr:hypothetical protein B0H21DRAFT_731150 [Amylocystis lapponica]